MATSTLGIKTRPMTRDKIATFMKSLEGIKAFEALQQDVSTSIAETLTRILTILATLETEVDGLAMGPDNGLTALELAVVAIALAREGEVQDLNGRLSAVEAELAVARSQINDTSQGIAL